MCGVVQHADRDKRGLSSDIGEG